MATAEAPEAEADLASAVPQISTRRGEDDPLPLRNASNTYGELLGAGGDTTDRSSCATARGLKKRLASPLPQGCCVIPMLL